MSCAIYHVMSYARNKLWIFYMITIITCASNKTMIIALKVFFWTMLSNALKRPRGPQRASLRVWGCIYITMLKGKLKAIVKSSNQFKSYISYFSQNILKITFNWSVQLVCLAGPSNWSVEMLRCMLNQIWENPKFAVGLSKPIGSYFWADFNSNFNYG